MLPRIKCYASDETEQPLAPVYQACVFNKMRLIVVGISFAIWAVAVALRITPVMARPTFFLLIIVIMGTLLGLPLYGLGTKGRLPRPLVMGWVFFHSLSDLLIILTAIHFTGGLESPGNLLLLTYLAGVALIFPRPIVLLLAALSATGYLVLGMGYAYGWWRAFYSTGEIQPIPSFRRALLITLSDWGFIVLISGIMLHLRHLLEQANQQLRQERNYLAQLRDVVHEGLHHRQVKRLAHYLVYHMGILVEASRGYLVLWDEQRGECLLVASTAQGQPGPSFHEPPETKPLEPWQKALVTQAREQDTLLLVPNENSGTLASSPKAELPLEEHTALVIPMRRAGQDFFGAVILLRKSPFGAEEIARARETAELLSLVLLRALAEDRRREEIQLLEELSQWASELMRRLDETALTQRIGEGARKLLQAPQGVLFTLDDQTGKMQPSYLHGINEELAWFVAHHYQELTDCRSLLQKNDLFVVMEDASTTQCLPPSLHHLRTGAQSGALVALQAPQGIQGILGLFWDHPFRLASEDQFALRLVGAYAGAALYNARLMRHLQQEAYTDPLTGLPNRRAFEEALQRETHRAQRYGHPYVLMVLDLNGFKAVNDTYGHLTGDLVLQQTASALRTALRESDFVARYGGDEFVALLPETTSEQAQIVGRKLVKQVESLVFKGLPDEIRCGLSVGIASFPKDGTDPQHLLAIADERMYANKAQQRAQRGGSPAAQAG